MNNNITEQYYLCHGSIRIRIQCEFNNFQGIKIPTHILLDLLWKRICYIHSEP